MNVLDQPSVIASLDAHGMLGILHRFSSDCAAALRCADSVPLPPAGREIDRIVVCAMGGSAMGGEILRRFALLPTEVNRSDRLLSPVGSRTLIVPISYSGNTTETLAALHQALETPAQFLCVSSGGRLSELAREHSLPLLCVPAGYPPRAALSYLGLAPLAFLARWRLAAWPDAWEEASRRLAEDGERFGPHVPTKSNPAKQIALALQGKVPVVLGVTGSTDLAALRWKTQINENAKQPAFWSALPELLHNEILAWENEALRRHMCALLLQSPDDAEIDASRVTWMAGRLREQGVPVIEVKAQGGSSLERLLRLVYLGDFVSVYLALCNGVDPTPISGIEEMKRSLGRVESNQPGVAS